jgi:hypothetical protein
MTEFEDAEGNKLTLENPISLNVEKSTVKVHYPLKYRKHFPAQLYEKVLKTVYPFCSEGILSSSGELVADSTCGFKSDRADISSDNVDYSGGFCCSCPAMTVFTGMSDGVYRGNCGLLSNDETAHCLEFSETMFAGYSISDFYYSYEITLTLSYPSEEEESGFRVIKEVLSIDRRAATNQILSAEIIGDYVPLKPPPDLKDKLLLRPLSESSPAESEGKVQVDWMVVNPGMVSMDGSECNKIGTSYKAFQLQSNKCEVSKGSCLRNQILDVLKAEITKKRDGQSTDYLLTEMGSFLEISKAKEPQETVQSRVLQEQEQKVRLVLLYKEIFTTSLLLTLEAGDFKFTTNLSKAAITATKVEDFEALKSSGKIFITVENVGENDSKFECRLDCSESIEPVPSQFLFLMTREAREVDFELVTNEESGQEHSCTVIVANALGEEVATEKVIFKTLELEEVFVQDQTFEEIEQDKILEGEAGAGHQEYSNFDTQLICNYLCPTMTNLFCFMMTGCHEHLIKFMYGFIILIGVMVAGSFILYLFVCKKKSHKEQTTASKVPINGDSIKMVGTMQQERQAANPLMIKQFEEESESESEDEVRRKRTIKKKKKKKKKRRRRRRKREESPTTHSQQID